MKAARTGRYAGLAVRDIQGRVVAAVHEHWFTVGATELNEAVRVLWEGRPDDGLPSVNSLIRLLPKSLPSSPGVTVPCEPDPELLAKGREIKAEKIAKAEDELAKCIETASSMKGKVGAQNARIRVAGARDALRRAKQQSALERAVRSKDAAFDLNVVREALQSLCVRTGILRDCGEHESGCLVTTKGIALVMPFRYR
jgi:hypothetical protein